ncbi:MULTISPECIES: HNH endonuclease [unclassified Bacillus (in: firmicutes)]|uniref:HNH endonuclease n=1 Tax=unclassified Bacillus (in: firmicutes) TaxID=185979 RepID=UPI0015870E14|nr:MULTISPECIES: HNH endonuclease [unclassified Bacillus (in: firmicutes)]
MSMLKTIGKYAGKTAGFVVGGPIQVIGELTGFEVVEDIGKGVRKASECAGETVGQAAGGVVGTVSGIINDNPAQRDQGLSEMGSAVGRTAKGVYQTAKHTVQNGGEVIGGLMDGDHGRVKKGAISIVKTVAIGALAVGVVDVIDGVDIADAEEIGPDAPTIEDAGETGSDVPLEEVPFETKTIELPDGETYTDSFPVFDVDYEVEIDEDMYLQSDYTHFTYANYELYEAIQDDPGLTHDLGLNQADIEALSNGDNPAGFTWHHNEEPGVLQLVDRETHASVGHTGGRELWGGGSEYR